MFRTHSERGMAQECLENALLLLDATFGALAPQIRQRVTAMSHEQLKLLIVSLATGASLKDLHLDD